MRARSADGVSGWDSSGGREAHQQRWVFFALELHGAGGSSGDGDGGNERRALGGTAGSRDGCMEMKLLGKLSEHGGAVADCAGRPLTRWVLAAVARGTDNGGYDECWQASRLQGPRLETGRLPAPSWSRGAVGAHPHCGQPARGSVTSAGLPNTFASPCPAPHGFPGLATRPGLRRPPVQCYQNASRIHKLALVLPLLVLALVAAQTCCRSRPPRMVLISPTEQRRAAMPLLGPHAAPCLTTVQSP